MNANDSLRVMLKSLKDIILETPSFRQKIDAIVQMIAQELCVGVCSIYLLNRDDKLELYATEGLSKESVNNVFVNPGEGIVGRIFRQKKPMSVLNVWNNEYFKYFPETAEDPYYTMIGVPIVFDANVIGVLAIQNRPNRPHPDNHLRILEALTAVIAELVVKSDIQISSKFKGRTAISKVKTDFISDGIANGRIVIHKTDKMFVYSVLDCSTAEDLSVFNKIFQDDFNFLQDEDKKLIQEIDEKYGFKERILSEVEYGLMPDCAVFQVYNSLIVRINSYEERKVFEKFMWSLILSFINNKFINLDPKKENGIIVFADAVSSKELLVYMGMQLSGIVVKQCAKDSHVAILARSFGIPVALCSFDHLDLSEYRYVSLNSTTGLVEFYKDQSSQMIQEPIKTTQKEDAEYFTEYKKYFPELSLRFNINLLFEAERIKNFYTDPKAGLVRTEMFFGHLPQLPSERVQIEMYKRLFSYIPSENCRMRFFDLSLNDRYFENDPFMIHSQNSKFDMGFRGVRVLLEQKDILVTQTRALLEAAEGKPVFAALPMVSCLDELLKAKEIINTVPGSERMKVGILIEVPSVVSELEGFVDYVDFFQVGTNDLLQFFYAIDRDCHSYTTVSLSVLTRPFVRILKKIADISNLYNKECIVCGVAASRPIDFISLYELGFREFSISLFDMLKLSKELRKIPVDLVKDSFHELLEEEVYDVFNCIQKKVDNA